MNDITVYLGQRVKGSLINFVALLAYAVLIPNKQQVFHFMNIQVYSVWTDTNKEKPQARLTSSVYLDRRLHDEISQALLLCFCTLQVIKNWSRGRHRNEATHQPPYREKMVTRRAGLTCCESCGPSLRKVIFSRLARICCSCC